MTSGRHLRNPKKAVCQRKLGSCIRKVHAIWSYKEQSYKEPALRILDLKNRFTFKERLSIEISGLKERLNFFSNFETFETK